MSSPTLASDRLRLRLTPALGGSVLAFELRRGDAWHPIWRPTPATPARANECASYVLAPYSNRLRDGRFVFEGRTYQLGNAARHALHGDACRRPWRVEEASASRARLSLTTRDVPGFDFPFPFRVEATWSLEGDVLVASLALSNTGDGRMPAGLGWHPYFVRALDGGASEVELEAMLPRIYPGEPPVPMLPTGPPKPVTSETDFSHARPVDVVLDDCFAGWDGRARFVWRRSGVTATLDASPRCRHVVIYSPAGQPFFAFEPITNANDGFNLMRRGDCEDGVVVLAPGETLDASFRLRVEGSSASHECQDGSTPPSGQRRRDATSSASPSSPRGGGRPRRSAREVLDGVPWIRGGAHPGIGCPSDTRPIRPRPAARRGAWHRADRAEPIEPKSDDPRGATRRPSRIPSPPRAP